MPPKLGDSASLWNFAPAPGWTSEEANVLKLCLMKCGVGQWQHIQSLGLLPGKLVQQLNGQAQRLIGQQSLSAFTGLQVDIDRIRIDNNGRQDVQRKGGLIIYDGPVPTREMKEAWRRSSKEKYGLSPEQLEEVEQQLTEIKERRVKEDASALALTKDGRDRSSLPHGFDVMSSDSSPLQRDDKLLLIRILKAKLAGMMLGVTRGLGEPDDPNLVSIASLVVEDEVRATYDKDGERTTMQPGEVPHKGSFLGCRTKTRKRVTSTGREMGATRPASSRTGNNKKGKRKRPADEEESNDGEWHEESYEEEEEEEEDEDEDRPRMDQACSSAVALSYMNGKNNDKERRGKSKAKEMNDIATKADVDALQEMMGISRQQAKEALEFCDWDLNQAAEYLILNLR